MMHTKLSKPHIYVPLAALCCLLWSSAFPFIKRGYRYFEIAAGDYASQILFAGCRFALAGVLTIMIASAIAKKPLVPRKKSTVGRIFILSLAQTAVQYTLFYLALAKIEGSAGSVINSAGTFFCVLLSAAVFQSDRLNKYKIIGCILGFGGIVLMNISSLKIGFHFGGEGLMLLSALCYAGSSILIKVWRTRQSGTLKRLAIFARRYFDGGVRLCIWRQVTHGERQRHRRAHLPCTCFCRRLHFVGHTAQIQPGF